MTFAEFIESYPENEDSKKKSFHIPALVYIHNAQTKMTQQKPEASA